MTDLTAEDFAEGQEYAVGTDGDGLTLRIDRVEAVAGAPRAGGGFRIEFVGPGAPLLPQATYALFRGGETKEIFIVPVAREPGGIRYEAVFN
jgi:hypothetical protein